MILAQIFETLDSLFVHLVFPVAVFFLIFGLDDLFIDFIAWAFRLKPTRLTQGLLHRISQNRERRIAILVASWKEGGVLERMIQGNIDAIEYSNYTFFLGVYPNDTGTLRDAAALEQKHPRVRAVLNPLDGPTSKGQMINELVRGILRHERETGVEYEAFLIHDSEDVIHPLSLRIINWQLALNDFVQVPVFSLPLSPFNWVAGTYIDEFAESHTKDMLVRDYLGVSIPSAGVGTAVSRALINRYLAENGGNLLNPNTLTEDYELGVSTWKYGFRSKFACFYASRPRGGKEFVATRELFPKRVAQSIRQKTRWTLGIAYQGTEHQGWSGSFLHKYFLLRDRKGPFANALTALGMVIFLYALVRATIEPDSFSGLSHDGELTWLFIANLLLMGNRILQRMICTARVYNWKLAAFVPIRLPIANFINAMAAYHATARFVSSKLVGKQPEWVKTEHELPEGFGAPATVAVEAEGNREIKAG